MKGISFLCVCIGTLFMSGCGSDSQSNTNLDTYTLTVDASQVNDAITLQWAGTEYEIAPQSQVSFTNASEEFSAPQMTAMPNHYACEMEVAPVAEFHYQANIQCQVFNSIGLETMDTLAYPVTIQYGEQTQVISNQGEIHFPVEEGNTQTLAIESTGGPQTCQLLGANAAYYLSCEPFVLSYGYINSRRNLYKISDTQTSALFEFDQPNDVLVYEDYFYLNDKMWFRGQLREDNQVSVFFAPIDNGQLQDPEKSISAVTSLSQLNDTAYALVENEIGDGGYKLQYFQEGEWKTALDHSSYVPLSGFINAGDHLQWYLRPKVNDGSIWLGRILKTQIEGANNIVWAKQLAPAFTQVTHNPMFKYDSRNFALGYDVGGNTLVEFTFDASEVRFTDNLEKVNTMTVWAGSDGNQYLFYTKENTVQQLSYKINDVAGSQAFNMDTLQAFNPTWVGGDLTQLAAGQEVNEEYGVLMYLRVGDVEIAANEIAELFETQSEVRVLFEKRKHGTLQISTPVMSKQGHLLVYVGQDDTGSVWLVDGLTPYKVEDNVSWDKFVLGYSIENVSPQHASVLDNELSINAVYKH